MIEFVKKNVKKECRDLPYRTKNLTGVMEQKSEKTARRTRCFRLGKLGCFTLIVLMVGLIACVTF